MTASPSPRRDSGSAPRQALDYPAIEPADRAAWRGWLAQHHRQSTPVWLVLRKGDARLTAEAATEEALCFGWIDSLPRKLDDARWKLLLSPRRRGSPWSAKNKATVKRLSAEGRIAPPGLAAIAAAQQDGSWTAYDAAERLEEPPDLRAALDAAPAAGANWAAFAPSSRKGILWWLATARTAATRAKRTAEIARLAALGLRANFPESRGR